MAATEVLTRPTLIRASGHGARWLADLPLLPSLILIGLVFTAVFANLISPYDPTVPIPGGKVFQPPFWMARCRTAALLGTDFQGRDVLRRMMSGGRPSR